MTDQRIVYTSSDALLPGMTRMEEWQFRMQATLNFDTSFACEQASQLAWEVTTHHFAGLIGVLMQLSPQKIERTPASLSQADVDYLMVDLILAGEVWSRAGHRETVAKAGDFLVLDLMQQSTITLHQPATLISWVLPRTALPQDPAALHGMLLDHRQPAARLLGAQLRELMACSPELNAEDIAFYGAESTHLLASTLSRQLAQPGQVEYQHPLLGRICLYIEQHLGDRTLSPQDLSHRFGLARASLYRLFEPMGGVASYIRKRRLLTARRCLMDHRQHHLRIGQIAHRCGLEASTFSRLYTQAFEMTPRQARTLSLMAHPLESIETLDIQRAHLGWFRQL
ncbi:AraC family transcriptional regulator [Halomonas sp. NyZ770]|uniref:helix-turn-helix domain-containing protein n=1 Tax=Halomonas sp. NyZ770 TaxID=2883106 RepID=UPI001D0A5502|nr:AraC family transcriptional regulator [Halomonas sp. NyZ770]UDM08928.1 AraC family transcriptional regulator [Halomonas sp. NyZ770]